MKTSRFPLVLAVLGGLASVAPVLGDDDEQVSGQGIVQLVPGASIAAFNQRYGTAVLDQYAGRNLYLLSVPEDWDDDIVESDPDVLWADLEYEAGMDPTGGTQSIFFSAVEAQYLSQPALNLIHLSQVPRTARGQGIIVAIIDSGISAHPLLTGSLLNGYSFVDQSGNTDDIGDGIDNDGDGLIDEAVGHGTMVAGLVHRVAPAAQLLPVKVMNSDGQVTTFRLAAGIYYAVDHGATVLNISMGTIDQADVLREAVEYALVHGAVIVSAVGNDNTSDPIRYPAGFSADGVLAICATDNSDVRATFSNYGAFVSLAAPGVGVTSTVPGGLFGEASGTSLGTPLVSGTAALLRSVRPTATPETIRSFLQSTTTSIDALNPGFAGFLGTGRLDAARAVLHAAPRPATN